MEQKRALIAMSGGVDSSVAALLMKQAQRECVGVTLKLYNQKDSDSAPQKTCCSLEDAEDARSVAFRLGMKFYVFNETEEFYTCVMKRFAAEYKRGCTPNPCIDCNHYLKFGVLFQKMRELQMDELVTGHYARIEFSEEKNRYLLKKALDPAKDQSYVLYMLTQEQLAHIRFPLGSLKKTQVRQIAEENGFVNAAKKDSQDICFVPDGDYAAAIERITGEKDKPGYFTDCSGNVIGTHRGITHYTLGQRRGLGISASERLYVTGIDPSENRVIVDEQKYLFHNYLIADQVNLIAADRLENGVRLKAKVRYRQAEQPAVCFQDDEGRLHVKFDEPQRAITAGQSVVLYEEDTVVGGGIIRKVGDWSASLGNGDVNRP